MCWINKCLFLLIFSLSVTRTECLAEETLCEGDEGIVFSCHLGAKTISLCQTGGRSIVYRYGTARNIELAYPTNPLEVAPFFRETAPVYGGGVEYVGFVVKGYEYRIYSKLARTGGTSTEDRVPFYEDGLLILKGGKQIKQLVCDDGGEGFRISLDWLPPPQ